MPIAKIAAVLPVYNGEEHLSEAISSVLSQDTADWMLYIIDDGSTDSTPEIVEEWRARYPEKIRLLHTGVNSGAAAACNVGLEHSREHPYVLIVNADDIQEPTRFSKLLKEIETTDSDIVIHDCEIIDEKGSKTGRSKGFENHITQRNVLAEQMRRNHFWSGLVLLKNSSAVKFDSDIKISEDYDFFIKLFYNGATFTYLDEKLLLYRVHNKNISLGYQKSEDAFVLMFEKYEIGQLEERIKDAYDEAGEKFISLAHVCMYRRQWDLALKFINEGVACEQSSARVLASLLFLKGYVLYLLHQFTNSLQAFSEGLERMPDHNPAFYNNIGALTYIVRHDKSKASEWIQKALEMESLYSDARQNLVAIAEDNERLLRVTPRLLRTKIIRAINA